MHVDLNHLVPVPAFKTECGHSGDGLAVCPTLGLLVTSSWNDNTLSVFTLPSTPLPASCTSSSTGAGLTLVCTLGGASSPAPMQFKFLDEARYASGRMVFTGPASSRLLLLTDAGHDTVHVIDVVVEVHVGYVAAPGAIAGPRGVAARGSLVAVSAWKNYDSDDH